jgi:hypothetical protein
VTVRIYVEGAAPGISNQSVAKFREALHAFLEKALGDARRPSIVPSGSRNQAYKLFCSSLKTDPDIFVVLLVDSEDPVADGKTAAQHLSDREKWTVADGQAHLMVQCMESWFLADTKALAGYYGQGFKEQALPPNPKIEKIPKADVMAGLTAATNASKTKGEYHKTRHGFDILGLIDANEMTKASPFANKLIEALREKLAQ